MGKGYCTYSLDRSSNWSSSGFFFLSPAHPHYNETLKYDSYREVARAYYEDWCNTKACFDCENHPHKSQTNNANSSETDLRVKEVICGQCGEKTTAKNYCIDGGSSLLILGTHI